jgi:hypothetical protein
MSEESTTQRALQIALSTQPALTTLTAPEDQNSDPDSPKPAIRRCCSAWQRAFKAYMKRQAKSGVDVPDENTGDQSDEEEDRSYDHIFAEKEAGVAYCNAMPMLAGHEGVRDFIACAAHGILIGAIPAERTGQLLYAAQIALAVVQSQRKSIKSIWD